MNGISVRDTDPVMRSIGLPAVTIEFDHGNLVNVETISREQAAELRDQLTEYLKPRETEAAPEPEPTPDPAPEEPAAEPETPELT